MTSETSSARAMMVQDWGGPDTLQEVSFPVPDPGPGEVVIDVRASACNFFDALIIAGQYQEKPPLPFAPGAEVSGTVRAVGEGVTHVNVGQRVLAMLPYGGFASVVTAPASGVYGIPDAMPFDQAAALGIVYQTSYFGLDYRANLQSGETLLVHAAAGGVGLAAVQIGKAMGARVLGTAGTSEKCKLAEEHGCDKCFNYREDDWRTLTKEMTEGRGADVIYDPVGGAVFDTSMRTLAFGGRLLVIGFASGKIPTVKANYVLLKNISVVGLHWGAYRKYDPSKIDEAMSKLFTMYEAGDIKPLVSGSWPLAEASSAIKALMSRKTVGKIVLTP